MSTPSLPLPRKEMDTVDNRPLVKFLHHNHTQDQLLGHTTVVTGYQMCDCGVHLMYTV